MLFWGLTHLCSPVQGYTEGPQNIEDWSSVVIPLNAVHKSVEGSGVGLRVDAFTPFKFNRIEIFICQPAGECWNLLYRSLFCISVKLMRCSWRAQYSFKCLNKTYCIYLPFTYIYLLPVCVCVCRFSGCVLRGAADRPSETRVPDKTGLPGDP